MQKSMQSSTKLSGRNAWLINIAFSHFDIDLSLAPKKDQSIIYVTWWHTSCDHRWHKLVRFLMLQGCQLSISGAVSQKAQAQVR